jgi:PAS domain-containing protein
MSIYLSIIEILKLIGLLGTALGVLMGVSKKVRMWVIDKYQKNQEYIKARHEMPNLLKNIDDRLRRVEYEISPNSGTSMKDSINIMKAEMDANNWLSPRPSFRCTSKGINTFVNEAYCHLCGVTPDELMKLGWKSFADDADQADDYYERFIQSTSNQSQFSGKIKIKNKNEEYQGEWIIRIRPLGSIKTSEGDDFLWHGGLYPFDNKAKEYAKNYNIPLI